MAVLLSPYGGVGAQFLDNSGNVLTGGKIYTYAAGTTTPQVAYASSAGTTPLSNPIILNAAGRVPTGEIWITDGQTYKFVLTDSNDVLIATYDNITGINSNFVNFTNEQEIQTATAGQTVFNLTTMTYQPATNSLSVFVDGVNQYGPGAQYAYVETDSDTVTFTSGLHVGAEVKFTTSSTNSSAGGDAFNVSYLAPFTGAVGTNVGDKLSEIVSINDFGGVNDGVTNNTTAFASADAVNQPIYVPEGVYYTTVIPTNKYYGPGQILVLTETFYLDYAIPTKLIDGLSAPSPDPEEDLGTRYFNLIAGQNSGAAVTSNTARATTIYGSEALLLDTDPVRATGFGKQVFKNMTDIYSSDAFGADAIGQGDFVNRCAGFGANTLKWAGSTDPVAVAHDYYRYLDPITSTGDFLTAVGLDAPNRWPTIRPDFVGSIPTPNPAVVPTSSAEVIQSVAMGRNALLHSLKTDSNVAVGVNAMAYALDNEFNVAVGTRALRDTVSGNRNTAVGNNAGVQNISGFNNVALGFQALGLGSHTGDNVAIGYNAAYSLTGTNVAPSPSPTARRNVYIGPQAGQNATDGAFNVAIGSVALYNNSASNNTAVGAAALGENTTGIRNTAVGFDALNANTTGGYNVAVGMYALDSTTTASENTAVGYQALTSNITGTQSVAVGFNSLFNNTVSQNTAIGHNALRFTQAGGSNIGNANCVGLGYDTRVSGSNQVQLGNSSTTTYAYGAVQDRSDVRDKADVKDTALGLAFIKELRPVEYRWDMRDDYIVNENGEIKHLPKDGSKKRKRLHQGLIAQDIKAVCEKLGVDFGGLQDHSVNGGDDVLTVGYAELIAPLIKAVQELSAEVSELKAKIKE